MRCGSWLKRIVAMKSVRCLLVVTVIVAMWWAYWFKGTYVSRHTGIPEVDSLLIANDHVNALLRDMNWRGLRDEYNASAQIGVVRNEDIEVDMDNLREVYFGGVISEVRPLAYHIEADQAITMNQKSGLWLCLVPFHVLFPRSQTVRESYHHWRLRGNRWYLRVFDHPFGESDSTERPTPNDSGWTAIQIR